MQSSVLFYAISGLWGVAMVANLIAATRICYAIEARSGRPMLRNGLPGFANVLPVAFNFGVAQDEETQEMRRQMNKRLIIIVVGFVFFFVYLRRIGAA
jgi:hypothetical protein